MVPETVIVRLLCLALLYYLEMQFPASHIDNIENV